MSQAQLFVLEDPESVLLDDRIPLKKLPLIIFILHLVTVRVDRSIRRILHFIIHVDRIHNAVDHVRAETIAILDPLLMMIVKIP